MVMYLSVLRLKQGRGYCHCNDAPLALWQAQLVKISKTSARKYASLRKKPGGCFMLLFPRSLVFLALVFASILTCGQTVTIVSPKTGSTVSSPVRVVANFSSTVPVETISVLLDGVQVAQPDAVTPLDIDVPMPAGNHLLTVNAVQSDGV